MLMRNMCFMSTNKQHMLIICMLSVNNENWVQCYRCNYNCVSVFVWLSECGLCE